MYRPPSVLHPPNLTIPTNRVPFHSPFTPRLREGFQRLDFIELQRCSHLLVLSFNPPKNMSEPPMTHPTTRVQYTTCAAVARAYLSDKHPDPKPKKKEENVPLSKTIRERFDEITKWRNNGRTWKDIDETIRGAQDKPSPLTLRNLYYRELIHRKSASRHDARLEAKQRLLDKRVDWPTILVHLQPDWDVTDTLPMLNRIIDELNSIDKARTRAQPEQLLQPEVAQPAPVAVSSAPKTLMST